VPEGSDIGDSRLGVSLAEWFVSGYDEAIVSPSFMSWIDELRFEDRTANTLLFNNFQTKVD
jgi:hypothetical protein